MQLIRGKNLYSALNLKSTVAIKVGLGQVSIKITLASTMEIGIFIYNNVEVIDFCGPFDVFCTANRFTNQHINVSLVAPTHSPVKTRGGLSVNPHYSIHGHPKFDLLVVAGGQYKEVINNPTVLRWLAETARHTPQCASVCTGVFIFAQAGIIDGKQVTTHNNDVEALQTQFPQLHVITEKRFITDNNFISSAGITAGIDMSLSIIQSRFGNHTAIQVAQYMNYHSAL
jgi:transcriptional regulator GlxA family with amidase domain